MNDDELMDQMLRDALRDDVPHLSQGFDQRVLAQVRPRRLSTAGRIVLGVYALAAVATTAWLMRDLRVELIAASVVAAATVAAAMSAYVRQFVERH